MESRQISKVSSSDGGGWKPAPHAHSPPTPPQQCVWQWISTKALKMKCLWHLCFLWALEKQHVTNGKYWPWPYGHYLTLPQCPCTDTSRGFCFAHSTLAHSALGVSAAVCALPAPLSPFMSYCHRLFVFPRIQEVISRCLFLQRPSDYLLLPFWLLLKAKIKTRIAEWELFWHLKYSDTEWD